jgi:eukaryotic-like serine/threonine-protein kinase
MNHPSPLEAIFFAALEKGSAGERIAHLDEFCGGDGDLRRRVEKMLAAQAEAGSFLEQPAHSPVATIDQPPAGEAPGTVIGPYKLLEQIGEGGFGVVFMAEQQQPVRRKVALKVLKPGMDTRQGVARFEAERQALALMDHPNIAHVFDGGATDAGRPYFVMELVRGVPITEFCDQSCLAIRQRLELFVDVCQAVQHAHQKGIIHRDIKPTNVMVTLHDGRPVVKVIDFGIAKAMGQQLTEKTLFTNFAQMIGTPLYMSPEQAAMSGLDVDTRGDVYSLGVMLYELLTGTTPFENARLSKVGYDEMRRIIREEEPPKPSARMSTVGKLATTASQKRQGDPRKLSKLFRGELDWIVMKALEKDRNRRYETANAFALDVRCYLNDEQVVACPPSIAYRFGKFARRNKPKLAVAGLLLFCVVLLGASLGWIVRDRSARLAATEHEAQTAMAEALRLADDRNWPGATAWIDRANALLAAGGSDELRRRVQDIQADFKAVARLQEIRLLRTNVKDSMFDVGSSDDRYPEAFREYLRADLEALEAREAGHLIGARSVPQELAAALDDWSRVRRQSGRLGWQHLTEVAAFADPDPWRTKLRAAWSRRDRKALVELAASDEVDGLPPPSVICLATSLDEVGEVEHATEVMRRGQRKHPNDFWSNFALAHCLGRLKPPRWAEAGRFLTAAAALRPESPGIFFSLAGNLWANGEPEEAASAYREAIRLHPDYPPALFNLGQLQRDKDPDEAIDCYEKLLRAWPESIWGWGCLGAALERKYQSVEAAVAACREATRHDENEASASLRLAAALSHKGRRCLQDNSLPAAVAAFEEAITLVPAYPWSHYDLGTALYRQGKVSEAVASCEKALDLDPNHIGERIGQNAHSTVIVFLAPLYAQLGHWEKAAGTFDRATDLEPTNRDRAMYAAALHAAAGNLAGYRRTCAQMVKQFGEATDAQTAERTAKACLLMPDVLSADDFDRVQRLAERAVTGTEKHGYYGYFAMAKGLADYRAGRYAEAIKWMQLATPNVNGTHWDATKFAVIAMAQHGLGHADEAAAALASAEAILTKMPDPVKGQLFRADDWHDWVHAQVLCREAEALLKKPATETGS